ncbi:hypothetical protein NUSPORA_02957 [Nucleospora cyclopteri]
MFTDFYNNVLQETTTSFIYGTVTNCLRNLIFMEENDNLIYQQLKGVREGVEYVQFNIVFSIINYLLKKNKIKEKIRSFLALFVSSYLIGIRNGQIFAIKSGLLGILTVFFEKII